MTLADVGTIPEPRTAVELAAEVVWLLHSERIDVRSAEGLARACQLVKIGLDDVRSASRRLHIPARYQPPRPAPPAAPQPYRPTTRATAPSVAGVAMAETSWVDRRCHRCNCVLGPDDDGWVNCELCRRWTARHKARRRADETAKADLARRLAKPVVALVAVRVRPDGEGMALVCRRCGQPIESMAEVVAEGLRHAECPAREDG